jgi:hypothetical protein
MEQRRAIAWAGSVALIGGVTVLVIGSTLGGFGLGISPVPQIQAVGPGLIPQTTQEAPVPGTPPALPVPSAPDPGSAPGDPVPSATTSTAGPRCRTSRGASGITRANLLRTRSHQRSLWFRRWP